MIVLPVLPPLEARPSRSFEIRLALILRVAATLELRSGVRDKTEDLSTFSRFNWQIQEFAEEVARLVGAPETGVFEAGTAWCNKQSRMQNNPLGIAYHALHTAAYLGLEGGVRTATVLAAAAQALEEFAYEDRPF